VPSFVDEFWRFYSSHLQWLLLFSRFSLSMSCCSFIYCICCVLFDLMASVGTYINCVVMYLFVCFTSNTAVNENENVFIRIFAN
jgi:hypothetical protein